MNNSIGKDLTKVVLWQYDHSTNLNAFIDCLQEIYNKSTEEFWNGLSDGLQINDPNKATKFGISVWSKILGIELSDSIEANGKEYVGTDEDKRKLIHSILELKLRGCSLNSLSQFAEDIGTQLLSVLSEGWYYSLFHSTVSERNYVNLLTFSICQTKPYLFFDSMDTPVWNTIPENDSMFNFGKDYATDNQPEWNGTVSNFRGKTAFEYLMKSEGTSTQI